MRAQVDMQNNATNHRPLYVLAGACAALTFSVSAAQTPAVPPAAASKPAQSPGTKPLIVTAVSANVNGAGEKIEFFINKWSTDADRDKLIAAWTTTGAPPSSGERGRGAGRGAVAAPASPQPAAGAAPAPAAAAPPDGAPPAPAAAAPETPAGQNAAQVGGRAGGRGGRGGDSAPAVPRTPEGALVAAMRDLPAVGYFWTSEVGGYLIRYAAQAPTPDGGTRIVLLTDKRLGSAKNNWRAVPSGTPNDYEFSLVELRLSAKGTGEGKASLTGTIAVDPNTKSLGLEPYDTLPVVLTAVKARSES